ncbi:hypothetical protein HAX54_029413 [Datura stramonium]|uniref:Uncharacterized protein n=1 Tax=Datura stramonium TaxID=4076 RepID=A0ABS8V6S1_DATST|nr:hypothetical protein [Datura stramonium]
MSRKFHLISAPSINEVLDLPNPLEADLKEKDVKGNKYFNGDKHKLSKKHGNRVNDWCSTRGHQQNAGLIAVSYYPGRRLETGRPKMSTGESPLPTQSAEEFTAMSWDQPAIRGSALANRRCQRRRAKKPHCPLALYDQHF